MPTRGVCSWSKLSVPMYFMLATIAVCPGDAKSDWHRPQRPLSAALRQGLRRHASQVPRLPQAGYFASECRESEVAQQRDGGQQAPHGQGWYGLILLRFRWRQSVTRKRKDMQVVHGGNGVDDRAGI